MGFKYGYQSVKNEKKREEKNHSFVGKTPRITKMKNKSLGAGRQFSHKSATACLLVRKEGRGEGGLEGRREEKEDLLTKVRVGSFQKVCIKHLLCIRPGYKTRTLVIRTRAWRGSKSKNPRTVRRRGLQDLGGAE